jgi:hypothetical protein
VILLTSVSRRRGAQVGGISGGRASIGPFSGQLRRNGRIERGRSHRHRRSRARQRAAARRRHWRGGARRASLEVRSSLPLFTDHCFIVVLLLSSPLLLLTIVFRMRCCYAAQLFFGALNVVFVRAAVAHKLKSAFEQ